MMSEEQLAAWRTAWRNAMRALARTIEAFERFPEAFRRALAHRAAQPSPSWTNEQLNAWLFTREH